MSLYTYRKHPIGRIGLLVLCAFLMCCAGCGARRSQQYTEQGETYLLIGNADAAETAFTTAFELDPKNARAKLGLARCYWLRKQADAAVNAYKEAIAIDPHLNRAYLEAARVYLATGDTKGAEDIASSFAEVDPVAGGILQSYVLRETGRAQDAVALLTKLREDHPDSVGLRVNLASSYLRMDEPEKAETELNTVLDQMDQNSLPARMLLVEVYQREGKVGEIVSQLRELVAQNPNNDSFQLALARGLLADQQFEEAENIAKRILEKTPESPWANFVVGSCLVHNGKYAEAVDCLSAAFGGLPEEPAVAEMLARAQGGGKAPASQLPAPAPGPMQAAAPASVESWHDLWDDARLEAFLSRREALLGQSDQDDLPETLVLAAIFSQDVKLAKELSAHLPADSPMKTYLDALLARNPGDAIKALDPWSDSTRDRQVMRANARGFAFSLAGAHAQALGAFLECSQNYPENGVALLNTANMYRTAGMPKFAMGALRKLIVSHGQNRQARRLLFEIMIQADMMTEARQLAESTFAVFPTETFSALMLAKAYRDTGNGDLAVDVLKSAIERSGQSDMVSLALADVLLGMGKVDEAQKVLDGAGDSQETALQKSMVKAFIAAAKGNWQEVESVCQGQAGAAYPLSLRLLHVAALVRNGKTSTAAEPLLSADGTPIAGPSTNVVLLVFKKLNGEASKDDTNLADALAGQDNDLAQYAYAMACREARFMSTAVNLLSDLDVRLRAKPRLVAFLLTSLAHAPDVPERLEKAQHYTEEYPALAAAWLGQAEVAHALNDDAEERAALEKAVEVQPDSVEAWLRYAQYFDKKADYAGMLKAFRQLQQLLPDDPFIDNNLAYCILQMKGDTNEALALAEKANEKASRNPEIVHTLSLAQFRAGKLDDAWKNVTLALEMRPGDPTLLLDAGQVLMAKGKKEDAQVYLRMSLRYASQLGVDFPRRAEAEQALEG